jgi:hypothetical protein
MLHTRGLIAFTSPLALLVAAFAPGTARANGFDADMPGLATNGTMLAPMLSSADSPALENPYRPRWSEVRLPRDEPGDDGAEGPESDRPAGGSDVGSVTAPPAAAQRNYKMEVGFRGRMVSVPSSILDIWYFDSDAPEWALPGEDRPRIRGYAAGVEFVVKGDTANGLFYFEYIKSTMGAGYWDDVEGDHEPRDGEYLVPSDNLGLIVLGANYAYEAHLVESSRTGGKFGWSLLVGGGLGIAFRTGSVDRWVADGTPEESDLSDPAYKLYYEGAPPYSEKANVPPSVLPMVDINGGMRFTFGDRVVVRVEGGLHTLVYYGASVGLMF